MIKRALPDEIGYIQRSFQRIGKQKPALIEILNRFEELALTRADIRARIESMVNLPEFSMNRDSFAQGIPVFHNFEFTNINREFLIIIKDLTPVLAKSFKPLSKSIESFNLKIENNDINIDQCIDAILADTPEKLENLSISTAISPAILQFILFQSVKIIFEIISAKLETSLDTTLWSKGYCPFCGSFPDISFLRIDKDEAAKSEFLKAHGGQFWLHCSSCSHEWRIKRHSCAYCGSEDKNSLQYFFVENNNKERIYTCNQCKHYIVSVDEREDIESNHPEAVLVGAVPLYMVAADKGFYPMVKTPLHG